MRRVPRQIRFHLKLVGVSNAVTNGGDYNRSKLISSEISWRSPDNSTVRRELCAAALIAVTSMATACGSTPFSPSSPPDGSTTLTPVPSTGEWPASTPDAEGLDAAMLADLVGRIRHGDYGDIGGSADYQMACRTPAAVSTCDHATWRSLAR